MYQLDNDCVANDCFYCTITEIYKFITFNLVGAVRLNFSLKN